MSCYNGYQFTDPPKQMPSMSCETITTTSDQWIPIAYGHERYHEPIILREHYTPSFSGMAMISIVVNVGYESPGNAVSLRIAVDGFPIAYYDRRDLESLGGPIRFGLGMLYTVRAMRAVVVQVEWKIANESPSVIMLDDPGIEIEMAGV